MPIRGELWDCKSRTRVEKGLDKGLCVGQGLDSRVKSLPSGQCD